MALIIYNFFGFSNLLILTGAGQSGKQERWGEGTLLKNEGYLSIDQSVRYNKLEGYVF
jgi:hypothetical protein